MIPGSRQILSGMGRTESADAPTRRSAHTGRGARRRPASRRRPPTRGPERRAERDETPAPPTDPEAVHAVEDLDTEELPVGRRPGRGVVRPPTRGGRFGGRDARAYGAPGDDRYGERGGWAPRSKKSSTPILLGVGGAILLVIIIVVALASSGGGDYRHGSPAWVVDRLLAFGTGSSEAADELTDYYGGSSEEAEALKSVANLMGAAMRSSGADASWDVINTEYSDGGKTAEVRLRITADVRGRTNSRVVTYVLVRSKGKWRPAGAR